VLRSSIVYVRECFSSDGSILRFIPFSAPVSCGWVTVQGEGLINYRDDGAETSSERSIHGGGSGHSVMNRRVA